MKFGEKVKNLRKDKGLTQTDLAKQLDVSLRTVISYETGKSYPKRREIYAILADCFHIDVNYLLTEDEEFIGETKEKYDIQCPKKTHELVAEIKGLFTSCELSEAEKDAVMQALQQAYWDSKEINNKYTSNKIRL
ncbi:helix-turn-helix domain-containing protein [Anaerotignum propionicum]|uniref:helix-turn-helix domain-containing protein n=1 Tax=Anaerotignum propionicum TaxID=28446 RepID=UPI00210E441A|nr:helix-turn-helix transcriptional regulator [Anaerotignum propionicum]MCQ4936040.1 helix-turn-helix domain-containing protein [Anaerotignum propionicum]